MSSSTAFKVGRSVASSTHKPVATAALPAQSLSVRRLAAIAHPIPSAPNSPTSLLPVPLSLARPSPVRPSPPVRSQSDSDLEHIFSYTSGRWLYNEAQQLAQRYTKFDVAALHRVIFSVCGSPVVGMEKKEGLFNKSFMCTLANGDLVTARVKNPIAGPAHLVTANEVATMDYVRNYLGVPVPKILAYSSQARDNGVGVEYIIMETAKGDQVSNVWDTMDAKEKKSVVSSLIETEQRLLDVNFAQYGSLYYKMDIPVWQQAPKLYAEGSERNDGAEKKFCIGPSANRDFYEDERAEMAVNRGPWSSAEEYQSSVALREEAWIKQHAKPNMHDDPFRSVVGAQSQDEHLKVLEQFRSVIPAITPKQKKVLQSVIWHPDLNAGNIFVSGGKVTCIIDWQGAWAGPAYMQMKTPSFLAYTGAGDLPSGPELPKLPPNFTQLTPEQQDVVRNDHRAKVLHKLYEVKQLLPYKTPEFDTRMMPSKAAGRTWKDGILPMRLALLDVYVRWRQMAKSNNTELGPCPVKMTSEEVRYLSSQRDRYCSWHEFLADLQNSFGVRMYGWVKPAEYDEKLALLENTRTGLDASIVAEANEIMPDTWWPFRNTV